MPTEEEDISIATEILNLAHSLNIQVVAEGVETVEQLQYLQSLQC
ncbi:MAG TPA: EAL domain-containing protein, partial [Thiomicrospira sp.]|nr:EAL domain-containing protein [Thiomicrospira sp.]